MCLPWLAFGPAAYPIVFFLGGTGPTLAAILLTVLTKGRHGVRELLSGICRWRVHPKWWLLALLGFPALMLAASIGQSLAGTPIRWVLPGDPSPHLPLMTLVLSIPMLALMEEIGWRGYAWPKLLERHGFLLSGTVIGTLWACWHLPLFFIKGMSHQSTPFLPYLAMAIGLSFWLGWLHSRTRSILLVTVFHAAVNYSGLLPGSRNMAVLTTLGLLAFTATAVLIFLVPKNPPPSPENPSP